MAGYSGWKDWDPNTHTVTVGKRESKYKAVRTEVDGVTFDSKRESARYQELLRLGQAGELYDLELQPTFPLHVNGVRLGVYRGDFSYTTKAGERVIEDSKSEPTKTPIYRWKVKHLKAEHGIEVREV